VMKSNLGLLVQWGEVPAKRSLRTYLMKI